VIKTGACPTNGYKARKAVSVMSVILGVRIVCAEPKAPGCRERLGGEGNEGCIAGVAVIALIGTGD
jgi:hypothetical protein